MAHLKELFLKVQRQKEIENEFNIWKKDKETKNKIYDVLITQRFKAEIIAAYWLPFKTINIDNNNTVFKLLLGKYDPAFGYSLNIAEVGFAHDIVFAPN